MSKRKYVHLTTDLGPATFSVVSSNHVTVNYPLPYPYSLHLVRNVSGKWEMMGGKRPTLAQRMALDAWKLYVINCPATAEELLR